MKSLQDQVDRRRSTSFMEISEESGKTFIRRKYKGSTVAFRLATCKTDRMFGCAACGTLLFRPLELREGRKFHLELSDSDSVLSVTHCANITFGPTRYKSDISETWKYDVQTIRCQNCSVYLGLSVTKISELTSWMEISSHGWCERMGAPLISNEISATLERKQRRGSMISLETSDIPVGGIDTQEILIGERYLRAFAPSGHDVAQRVRLVCKECDNILSYADQILCTRRRWGFGDGPNEPACYMNSLRKGSFRVRNIHERELAQGNFEMGDVYCGSCDAQVGYKFHQDKSPTLINENQQGRYGLVISRLRLINTESRTE
eukprot:CAMPEP_0197528980 /NCGR_PEP_ID=MMETSP1318-20131121/26949_1 /TAXON_ID=552666 /ORGANISM="Partenskyella glossopodia, Strain RCC365" /LENGTH=319 /DNA_ID=CAMNT_0043084289 /DNA_START=286 /DNA_END=1245 /DNA_ORIENTATION=-